MALKLHEESRILGASPLGVPVISRPGELGAAGREAGTRRDYPGCHRGVKRQDLVLVRFDPEEVLQFLELIRVILGHVVVLGPILG